MSIMDIVNFGEHFVEIGILLRDITFVNGILKNSEVWYNLLKQRARGSR